MKKASKMKRVLNALFEDFFDDISNNQSTDDLESEFNDYSETDNEYNVSSSITKDNAKYIMKIILNVKPQVDSDNNFTINIDSFVKNVQKIVELNAIFPDFSVSSDIEISDFQPHSFKETIKKPYPSDFNLEDFYIRHGKAFWPPKRIDIEADIYFNKILNLSYNAFVKRIYTLYISLNKYVTSNIKDYIVIKFNDNGGKKDNEISFYNTAMNVTDYDLKKLYNKLSLKSRVEIGSYDDYIKNTYQEIVAENNNLRQIAKIAIIKAKKKYNVDLHLVEISNNKKMFQEKRIDANPMVAFDLLTSKAEISIRQIEEYMFYSFFTMLPLEYFDNFNLVVVVRPDAKVFSDDVVVVSHAVHSFNNGKYPCESKALPVTRTDSKVTKYMPRLRKFTYSQNKYLNFYLLIVDKKGKFMKDPSVFSYRPIGENVPDFDKLFQTVIPSIKWPKL